MLVKLSFSGLVSQHSVFCVKPYILVACTHMSVPTSLGMNEHTESGSVLITTNLFLCCFLFLWHGPWERYMLGINSFLPIGKQHKVYSTLHASV